MDGKTLIKTIGKEMLDLVYPPSLYCISCGKIIDESRTYRLCNECMAAMNWNTGRWCSKCGRPLAKNDPGSMCFGCTVRKSSGQPHGFDKGHVCTGYGAVEQSVIFAFKYGGRSDLCDTLGEMLYDRMASEYEPDELADMYDLVIPVPTFKEKKSKRGYNHAELMAQSFAKRAGILHAPDVIIRTRSTLPMKGLDPAERVANIRGAFCIKERGLDLISGARILLIDDIFTTGATIDEIAYILKNPEACGMGRHSPRAKRVDFLAFAAAGDMINPSV